jgi:hypothetical protein
LDGLHEFRRRFKAERGGVADVEFENLLAGSFEALGFLQYRTANIVANPREFARLSDWPHEIIIRYFARAARFAV